MTSPLPPRPDWVDALLSGAGPPSFTEEAALPLERDALLAEACARQGRDSRDLRAFGPSEPAPDLSVEAMIEALDRLLPTLESEAGLHLVGRWMTRRFLLRLLEVRLQLWALLRSDPGLRDERIEAPIVVAGPPRTGTTLLHGRLARDPALRAPRGWELLRPVPSPAADAPADDPRVVLAERELVRPQTVVSGLRAIHVYGARQPKECLSAMSFAFRSEEFTARYDIPSYERWLTREADPEPAYAMHRLVLQVLQRRDRTRRWVLKSPVHLHALETLARTYPDVRIVVTHRDPLRMLASLASLIATLRWAHSDHVDLPGIARSQAERQGEALRRLTALDAAGTPPSERIVHLGYDALVRDPDVAVETLRRRWGIGAGGLAAGTSGPARATEIETDPDAHGRHRYAFEGLGLDRERLRAWLRPYQERFGVPDEI